jgi:ferredoxin
MPRVTFAGDDREADVGLRGQCRVRVLEGEDHLTEPGLQERRARRPRNRRDVVGAGKDQGERLGCQALVLGDVVVKPRLWDEQ